MDLETLWQEFFKVLSAEVGSRIVETWFKSITFVRLDSQAKTVFLQAPNYFIQDWVTKNYYALIQRHLGRLLSENDLRIVFVDVHQRQPGSSTHSLPPRKSHEKSLDDVRIIPAKLPLPEHQRPQLLSHNYLFDTFVVGPGNSLAFAAAHAVTQNPGFLYNPLLICGGSGLGKTHLLHAIGNQIKHLHKKARVFCQSADRFINDFIASARSDRIQQFEARYRGIDVFLIDDIQLISRKKQTQEIFFQIFNGLHQAHKQVVVTCDILPRDIPGLSERMRSRLESGLITDLQKTSLETRVAILHEKAKSQSMELPGDIAHFIATQVGSNIRNLEGALIRILAFASLTKQPITLDLVRHVLIEVREVRQPARDLSSILKHVSRSFEYPIHEIKSSKRTRDLTFARHVAIYLMKNLTDCSLREIAAFIDRKDHSSIIHALCKVEQQRISDQKCAFLVEKLMQEIQLNQPN